MAKPQEDGSWQPPFFGAMGLAVGICIMSAVQVDSLPAFMGNVLGSAIGAIIAIFGGIYLADRKDRSERTAFARALGIDLMTLSAGLNLLIEKGTGRAVGVRALEAGNDDTRAHLPLPPYLGPRLVSQVRMAMLEAELLLEMLKAEDADSISDERLRRMVISADTKVWTARYGLDELAGDELLPTTQSIGSPAALKLKRPG